MERVRGREEEEEEEEEEQDDEIRQTLSYQY